MKTHRKAVMPVRMGFVIPVILLLFAVSSCAGIPSQKFQKNQKNDVLAGIRNNETELHYFFSQMPKGADLHNHLTGSAYAETYFKIALDAQMYVDTQTYKLYKKDDKNIPPDAVQLKPGMSGLHAFAVRCIDHWSVRNYRYYTQTLPPDEFFFGTFGIFSAADNTNEYAAVVLREIRARAELENVLYLEIMLTSPAVNAAAMNDTALNDRIKAAIQDRDEGAFMTLLSEIWDAWERDPQAQEDIATYVRLVEDVHGRAADTAPDVVSRYHGYASRNSDPLRVFSQLYIGFKACSQSPLLVGVNIVSSENGETALRDYWGHMEMFKYLKSQIPVKVSLHAGELRLGLVPPEELSFHISDAVRIAGADRIGHGVDIAFESDASGVLAVMAEQDIAVEINLVSNEFILGVQNDGHPLLFYHRHHVPIVLSTDDPGILRSNLTEQYVLAVQRYPELTYSDIKQFTFNSIRYSFLPDTDKEHLLAELEQRFHDFERRMLIRKN